MKKLLSLASLTLLAWSSLLTAPAQAATVGSNFNVTVTLTSVCKVKTASAAGLAFTYTAFQGTPSTGASTAVVFECTRGFGTAPTVVLDTATDATSAPADASTSGVGVVGGLQYSVDVAAATVATGNAASTNSIGSSTQYSYAITGSMPAGQAGDSSKLPTQQRTLTVSY